MSTGALFSGLIGGYGKQIIQQTRDQHDDEVRDKANQIEILRAAASAPDITDEAKEAIWGQMWDLASGKKPGAKGKGAPDPMHTMFGHLTGMTTPGGPQPAVAPPGGTVENLPLPAGTQPQPQNLPQPAGAQPQPVSLGQPPTPPTIAAGSPSPAATSQAGTLGTPPAPPQFHMFKTKAQKAAEATQAAKDAVDQSVAARQQQEEGYNQAYRDSNDGKEPPDDVKKANHDFAFFGIHPASKRTVDTSSTFTDPKTGLSYHNVLDDQKNVVGQVPAMAKPNRYQQQIQDKVANWQSVNKQKPDESPEDYAKRGEVAVRQQQFATDSAKLIGLGLGNQAKQAQIQHIQQMVKNGDLNTRSANVLWKGAFAAARARKQTDLDAMDKPINSLVDEELQKLGTSMAEVSGVIRGGMQGGGGTKKPAGKITTADDLAASLGLPKK